MTFSLRRLLANFGAIAFNSAAFAVVQIALVPVLAVQWGLHVYGAWLLLVTVPAFLAMSDLGFATAAGTRMTMLAAQENREEAQSVFQSAWVMVLASSLLCAAAGLLIAWLVPAGLLPVVPGFSEAQARCALSMLILYGLIALAGNIVLMGFRSTPHFHLGVHLRTVTLLLENGMVITAVLLGADPFLAAAALALSRLAGLVLQYAMLRRKAGWLRLGFADARLGEIRILIRPALALMAFPLSQASLLQGVTIALGAAAGAGAVPALTTTRTLSRFAVMAVQIVAKAISPELSAVEARGDDQGKVTLIAVTAAAALLISIPYALVMAVFGEDIVRLWSGGAIAAPQSLLVFMSLSVVFGGLWNPLAVLTVALQRQGKLSLVLLGSAAVAIGVAFALSQRYGASGAAAAAALADGCILLAMAVRAKAIFGPHLPLRSAVPALKQRILSTLRS